MSHNGILSKNAEIGYKASSGAATYTKIPDLQSIGKIGSEIEKVEVTTLDDSAHIYIKGLDEYDTLECVFLYANGASDAFRTISALDGAYPFQITLPDETKLQFDAETSWAINEMGINDPITFTMSLVLKSEITIVNPV